MPTISTSIDASSTKGTGSAFDMSFGLFLQLLASQPIALLVSLFFVGVALAANWWSVRQLNADPKQRLWFRRLKKPNKLIAPVFGSSGDWLASCAPSETNNPAPVRFGLFGWVWVGMFLMMGISSWLIYAIPAHNLAQARRVAGEDFALSKELDNTEYWKILMYVVQVCINAFLGPSMFVFQDISLVFLLLMLQTGVSVYVTSLFGNVSQFASLLLLPFTAFILYLIVVVGIMWFFSEGKQMLSEMNIGPLKDKGHKSRRKVPAVAAAAAAVASSKKNDKK